MHQRLISVILAGLLVFSGCFPTTAMEAAVGMDQEERIEESQEEKGEEDQEEKEEPKIGEQLRMDDPAFLEYTKDAVYDRLNEELDPQEYHIEEVTSIYYSKEYLEEMEYNSLSNIFFGYTLEELEEQFQGTRYVFALGEDGETMVCTPTETSDGFDIGKAIGKRGVVLLSIVVTSVGELDLGGHAIRLIYAFSTGDEEVVEAVTMAATGIAYIVMALIPKRKDGVKLKEGCILLAQSGIRLVAICGRLKEEEEKRIEEAERLAQEEEVEEESPENGMEEEDVKLEHEK